MMKDWNELLYEERPCSVGNSNSEGGGFGYVGVEENSMK